MNNVNQPQINGAIQIFKQPSALKGEVPLLTLVAENATVGKLWATGGVLSFEGNAEESAKVFFDHVIKLNSEHLTRG